MPTPPFWVGNAAPTAIRRAARLGDGWFPSMVTPDQVAAGAARLAEVAGESGRPVPTIAVGTAGALGSGPGTPTRNELAASLAGRYALPEEQARKLPIVGTPAEAAERFAVYRQAGVHHVVFVAAGGDWHQQIDLLAEARSLSLV